MFPSFFSRQKAIEEGTERAVVARTNTLKLIAASLALCCTIILLVNGIANSLPNPRDDNTPITEFSEARARKHLKFITAQTRHVGSIANEIDMPKYIEEHVKSITTIHQVDCDSQVGSGSFNIDFLGGFTSVYIRVKNILVLLTPASTKEKFTQPTLLISAHYDSAVGIVGAADNAANVANLLEIYTNLASSRDLAGPVLFVFNGAEETIMQGSHSLVKSNHRFLTNVYAFINLEAAGSGGRELLFQTSSRHLLNAWARAAPHPWGNVVALEVFQSGVIPSDTDYRMYRLLDIPGLDFANSEAGHLYHTPLDVSHRIAPGALQRYGENILATTRELLLHTPQGDSHDHHHTDVTVGFLVFFDVFGFFVIAITSPFALILCFIAFIVVVGAFLIENRRYLDARGFRNELMTIAYTILFPLGVGIVMSIVAPLSFYKAHWWILFVYGLPAICGLLLGRSSSKSSTPPTENEVFSGAIFTWTLLFLILVLAGKGSSYLPFCWAFFPVLVRMVVTRMKKPLPPILGNPAEVVLSHTLGVIVPMIVTAPLLRLVLTMFLPLTGRTGSRVPGDVVVSVLVGVSIAILFLVPSSLAVMMHDNERKYVQRLGWRAIVVVIAFSWLSGQPFNSHFPKRLFVMHVDRRLCCQHDIQVNDFLWVVDADSTGLHPVLRAMNIPESHDPSLSKPGYYFDVVSSSTQEAAIYGNLPYYFPLMKDIPKTAIVTTSIPLPHPSHDSRCEIEKSREIIDKSGRRVVSFHWTGWTDHANLYFPANQVAAWSLNPDGEPLAISDGHVYVLMAGVPKGSSHGRKDSTLAGSSNAVVDVLEFSIVTRNVNAPLRLAWACHYLEERSPELDGFVKQVPDWVTTISFTSRWRDLEV